MKITEEQLNIAVQRQILTTHAASNLWEFLQSQRQQQPKFDASHVLYYMGGLIAIGAMTVLMGLGWESFGGWGIFSISIVYALIGLFFSKRFKDKQFDVPAGICATFVIALTPLAVYGLQQAVGWWPADGTIYHQYHTQIRYHWFYMELATLLVGSVMIFFIKYPFLVMPLAATLWYMSMDLASVLTGTQLDLVFIADVSLWFGLGNLLLALWVDFRSKKQHDYAFWLYLSGLMAFWGGLTSQNSDIELAKFFYFLTNLGIIGIGVVLVRRVFVVFGALGCLIYLGHLSFEVFKDSWLFPISLTALGLIVIYLGIVWHKNDDKITGKLRSFLPRPVREFLNARQYAR